MRNIVVVLLVLLISCSGAETNSPEEQVRQTIESIKSHAENRSLSELMDHVSEQYNDHQGKDKTQIKRMIQLLFLRNQNIHIFSRIQSIDIQENVAAVEISAAMASQATNLSNQNWIKANTFHFSVLLKNADNDSEWKVDSVSWRRG